MNTTLVIKTNKNLRDEAKAVSAELGVPLTTVMNAMLKQFVREKKISLSVDPRPTKSKLALFENISREINRKSGKKFSDVEKLIAHLKI